MNCNLDRKCMGNKIKYYPIELKRQNYTIDMHGNTVPDGSFTDLPIMGKIEINRFINSSDSKDRTTYNSILFTNEEIKLKDIIINNDLEQQVVKLLGYGRYGLD